jgi:phosphatidylglycerol---prolipoprotein diacylglyceryl transferase
VDPILVELGPFRIYWYGLFMVLGIFAAFEISKRLVKRWGYDPNLLEQVGFWGVFWGVIGARLFYVLTSPSEFNANPIEALYIWKGGLSFHGGILLGIVPFVYYYYRYNIPVWAYFDAIVPGVSVGIMMGRLGNIMNGSDTVGRLTDWPLGFTWPSWATGFPGVCKGINDISQVYTCAPDALVRGPVHFTQFYGVLIGLALLLMSIYWLRQNRRYGYVFWQFILWYSLLRAGLEETFRLNPLWIKSYVNESAGIGFFTATQIFSIPIVLLALFMLFRWRGPRNNALTDTVAIPAETKKKR